MIGMNEISKDLYAARRELEAFRSEWVNARALEAAVGAAQQEAAAGEAPWSTEQILDQAELFREFIRGDVRKEDTGTFR